MRSSQVADNNQKKHVLLERFRLGIRGRILLISSILIVMMLMMTLYLLDKLSNSLENNMEFHVKSTRDNIFRNLASIQSQSLAYARMLSSIDLIKSSIDNRFIGELQKQIKPVIKDLHVDLIAVYDRDGQELVKVESDEAQEVSFQVESVDKKGNKLPALNFGVTPGDFQADYRKDFLNFLKYLQQNVGYQFRLIVSQDYFSLARDIARGYIHVGWMPPAAYVTAREAFKDNVVYLASARGKEEKYYR